MTSAMMVIHSDEELSDLYEWMTRDGANFDNMEHWDEAAAWLFCVKPQAFPWFAPVPSRFIEPLEAVIDDWTDLLGAAESEEDFRSYIQRAVG